MTPRSSGRFDEEVDADDAGGDGSDDLDVTPAREGADIVKKSELGDGEHISTDLEAQDESDDDDDEDDQDDNNDTND